MLFRRVAFGLVALLLMASAAVAEDFFFKKDDRVVIMGDSITEQRLYSNYVELWSVTRFPQYKLVFRNVGIGGDTSGGGNGRFKRDVLPFKATAMTVDFGMNDGRYIWPGRVIKSKDAKTGTITEKIIKPEDVDSAYATYMKGLQGIADQAKAAGVRVAWVTPQPVEHNPGTPEEQYNQTLEKFSAGVKEIANKNGGLFVDQFHPYWAVIHKAREAGEKGRITGGDAVHPGPPGQALMAASILKGMSFPRLVSRASIDVSPSGRKRLETTNCKINHPEVKEGALRFERIDFALPFFPQEAKSILKWTPLLEDMNEYGLQVKGLALGKYEVRLGGKKAAEYSAEELAKGVNLASAALAGGPVAEQVAEVVKAVTDKTNYYHDKIYRGVVLADPKKIIELKDAKTKEELEGRKQALIQERLSLMPELEERIHAASRPRAYQVEIVAIK
jgi:lysophospholipase L1-like esterase